MDQIARLCRNCCTWHTTRPTHMSFITYTTSSSECRKRLFKHCATPQKMYNLKVFCVVVFRGFFRIQLFQLRTPTFNSLGIGSFANYIRMQSYEELVHFNVHFFVQFNCIWIFFCTRKDIFQLNSIFVYGLQTNARSRQLCLQWMLNYANFDTTCFRTGFAFSIGISIVL